MSANDRTKKIDRRSRPRSKAHLEGPIQIQVREIGQIFQTLDPLPFRERDLDAGVEEYILGWAGEFAEEHEILIIVHLPPAEAHRTKRGT